MLYFLWLFVVFLFIVAEVAFLLGVDKALGIEEHIRAELKTSEMIGRAAGYTIGLGQVKKKIQRKIIRKNASFIQCVF